MPQERLHVVRPKMSSKFLKRSGTGKSYLRIRKNIKRYIYSANDIDALQWLQYHMFVRET